MHLSWLSIQGPPHSGKGHLLSTLDDWQISPCIKTRTYNMDLADNSSIQYLHEDSQHQFHLSENELSPTFMYQMEVLNCLYDTINTTLKKIRLTEDDISVLVGIHNFDTPVNTYFPALKKNGKINEREFLILNNSATFYKKKIERDYPDFESIKKVTVFYTKQENPLFCKTCEIGVCQDVSLNYHEYYTSISDYILKDQSTRSINLFGKFILDHVLEAYKP